MIRRIQKPAIRSVFRGPSEPAAQEILTLVDEMAEYPGGVGNFQKHLEKFLTQNYYKYPDALVGDKYLLYFEVSTTGQAIFLDLKGFESHLLKADFRHFVATLPYWKSSKLNGRAIPTVFEVVLVPGT